MWCLFSTVLARLLVLVTAATHEVAEDKEGKVEYFPMGQGLADFD